MNFCHALLVIIPSIVNARYHNVEGVDKIPKYNMNLRVERLYSTQTYGEQLITPGTQFMIDPSDQFDSSLLKGEGSFESWKKWFVKGELIEHVVPVEGANAPLQYVIKYSELTSAEIVPETVPMPSFSLSGNILKVETVKKLSKETTPAVCHKLETDRYVCHIPKEVVDVHVVTVSLVKDPSVVETLWVAHHAPEFEGALPVSHVMNIGDVVFKVSDVNIKPNLRQ